MLLSIMDEDRGPGPGDDENTGLISHVGIKQGVQVRGDTGGVESRQRRQLEGYFLGDVRRHDARDTRQQGIAVDGFRYQLGCKLHDNSGRC